jgi:hypothetical protein
MSNVRLRFRIIMTDWYPVKFWSQSGNNPMESEGAFFYSEFVNNESAHNEAA